MIYQENEEDIHVLERINAMLEKENTTQHKTYNFTSEVNASCRKAMIEWCFTVCDAFDSLQRETVGISASILDRYLSCKKGESALALMNRQRFQLTTITCFYISVKLHETVALSIGMLIKLCRGWYTEEDIVAMELEILSSLEWRVSLSTVTPIDYVRHFLELLPEYSNVAEVVLENATRHVDIATADVDCCSCKASSVGVVCLAGALNDTYELSSPERDMLWSQLSRKLVGFDIASNEIRTMELKLLAKTPMMNRKQKNQSPSSSLIQCGVHSSGDQMPPSPVSIVLTTSMM